MRRALCSNAMFVSLVILFVVGGVVVALAVRDSAFLAMVAVADFVNETYDVDLDGLSGMLIISLEQSQRLSVLTRGCLCDLFRQHGGFGGEGLIDETRDHKAARLANADALLLTTIHKFDDLYRIELQMQDPHKEPSLFTLTEKELGKTT